MHVSGPAGPSRAIALLLSLARPSCMGMGMKWGATKAMTQVKLLSSRVSLPLFKHPLSFPPQAQKPCPSLLLLVLCDAEAKSSHLPAPAPPPRSLLRCSSVRREESDDARRQRGGTVRLRCCDREERESEKQRLLPQAKRRRESEPDRRRPRAGRWKPGSSTGYGLQRVGVRSQG
jgi:hypothetical protein